MKGFSFPRVRELVKKELRQLFRDPRTKRLTFGAPVIQLFLFGYAANTDVRDVPTFLVDQDLTAASRRVRETLEASGYFRVVGASQDPRDLEAALGAGEASVGVWIPRGFGRGVRGKEGGSLQILLDGTSSNTATVIQGYLGRLLLEADLVGGGEGAGGSGFDLRTRAWYNPDLASVVYNVPGVMGLLLVLMALLLTALSVVRERELGTFEQLLVSPLTPWELMAGKALPVVLICLVDLALVALVGTLWFGVPFRGSVGSLVAAASLYIMAGVGLGLLVSTLARTQQEAFLTMFFFLLPGIILSGFMYPVETMPPFFQKLTLFNPIRYFLEMVRGIFLKGLGVRDLALHFLVLGAMALLTSVGAVSRFRRSLGLGL